MKKLLVLTLALLSFGASAVTISTTTSAGVSNSTHHGRTVGTVNYASVDYSHSTVSALGVTMESTKVDRVEGEQSSVTKFGGNSSEAYAGWNGNFNGAEVVYVQSNGAYSNRSNSRVTDNQSTSGFELNTNSSMFGNAYEYSSYDGSFTTNSHERTNSSGTSSTTTFSWY